MGLRYSKEVRERHGDKDLEGRVPMTLNLPQGLYGRFNCKSCWFANRGLIACSDHYLCLNCLTRLRSQSQFCGICGKPLPTKIRFEESPSAPPYEP
ncbi:Z protein [Mammarenavirus piritalense]|uniref:RING finger protein Z n=1 Tax=Pirital mammarenavirus (isolate Rat/Venezuela/VAV-488/1995) TaxID=3052324 RepID=Z_PIRVV|nr:Z protein [Mammarenavirus piritalense]Q6RSS3.1 RecName: Full=RING finger protein Z; Short=Protein Z; AltName: Full=Zinc-binding protein [Mammarenavirus piritalense]AAS72553.1 Z protein [Mammarenavirus piritalense]